MPFTPMPLVRIAEPFSDPDWIWELKYDGFRALAYLDAGNCTLVSRNGNTFTRFDGLAAGLARAFPTTTAILDGEIVCLDARGCSQFRQLLFRRSVPVFAAFDLLRLGDDDLCGLTLLDRKDRLSRLIGTSQGPLLRVQHVAGTDVLPTTNAPVRSTWRAPWASGRAAPTRRGAARPRGRR